MAQLLFRDGVGVINLVAKDKKGDLLKLLHRQESVELGLRFGEALVIFGIYQENDTVDLGEVVLPKTAGLLVTTKIKGCESYVADGEFLGSRVQSGLQDGDSVVLQHVQECRLSGIVETEEEELGVLVEQAEGGQDIVDCEFLFFKLKRIGTAT